MTNYIYVNGKNVTMMFFIFFAGSKIVNSFMTRNLDKGQFNDSVSIVQIHASCLNKFLNKPKVHVKGVSYQSFKRLE